MYGSEAEQLNNAVLHIKQELVAVKKQTEENGPSTAALLTLITIIDSLSTIVRQLCLVGDRHEGAHR